MGGKEFLDPYTLCWPDGVFPLGQDALALGNFASLKSGWQVCDLGTGSGVLLLLLAGRQPNVTLLGVERDLLAAQTARENLERNGLAGHIVPEDLRQLSLPAGTFDLVVSNPPYFSVGSGDSAGPERSEEQCTLEELCTCAGRLLRNGGRFALCHRPERLTDLLCTLRTNRLEPKRLELVSHDRAHPPSLILIECIKQGRSGVKITTSLRFP